MLYWLQEVKDMWITILIVICVIILDRWFGRKFFSRISRESAQHLDRLGGVPGQYPQQRAAAPLEEQIAACRQSLTQYRRTEDASAAALLYTSGGIHRAVILQQPGGMYLVKYETLLLPDDEELMLGCTPGPWLHDGGESCFSSFEEAEAAARSVLKQLEKAELSAVDQPLP